MIKGIFSRVRQTHSNSVPILTERVQEWCAANNAQCRELAPAEFVPFLPAQTVGKPIFFHKGMKLRAKYLAALEKTWIAGGRGLVLLPDNTWAAEVAPNLAIAQEAVTAFRAPAKRMKKRGNYFSLITVWGNNYYHWLHDTLMTLRGIIDFLPSDTHFIVPAGMKSFQERSLAAIGIEPTRWLTLPNDEMWELEVLYFSPVQATLSLASPHENEWLHEHVLDGLGISSRTPERRIYITRQSAKYERMVNEIEVLELLRKYDFETVACETLSFDEQVKLFSQASIIAGPHGAGLSNMLWAPTGTRILDVFDESFVRSVYWALSTASGFDYWYLIGEAMANPDHRTSNVFAPLPLLQQTLDAMLRTE